MDDNTVRIVVAAFEDLIERGYDRHEIEQVFSRFKSRITVGQAPE